MRKSAYLYLLKKIGTNHIYCTAEGLKPVMVPFDSYSEADAQRDRLAHKALEFWDVFRISRKDYNILQEGISSNMSIEDVDTFTH